MDPGIGRIFMILVIFGVLGMCHHDDHQGRYLHESPNVEFNDR
jgi:hypothetical protein